MVSLSNHRHGILRQAQDERILVLALTLHLPSPPVAIRLA